MRILVIRGGALGDLLVTLPTLRVLRERWPEAHIELLGHPHLAQVALQRYYLDAVRSVDHRPLAAFFMPNAILDPEWMDYIARFDLVLSFFYDPDELFLTNLKRCDPGRIVTHSPKVPEDFSAPAARYFGEILEPLGLELTSVATEVFPKAEDQAAAREFFGELGEESRLVAVHPGSGSPKKNWPMERWASWGRKLCAARADIELLLISGEADGEVAQTLREAWRDLPVRFAAHVPLPTLAAILRQTVLYLGHDTGITHLAAASHLERPVLALFGPTSPTVWAPPHPKVHTLSGGKTLLPLGVEHVVAKSLELLGGADRF